MKRIFCLAIVSLAAFNLIACSGGGGVTQLPQPPAATSSITGSAIKGPVDGATIQLYYFNNTGAEVEITADNAPVTTDSTGAYNFQVDGRKLMGITSPLIVRSTGGTMYGGPAPILEGIIADPVPLTFSQVSIICNLSAPSSVAVGLLRKLALSMGFAPDLDDAQGIIALVEAQLMVDLSEDPSDTATDLAMFNESVDQNLDLLNTPANNPAVDDFITYLIANLSSSSGILDRTMDSPSSPGTDTTAVFAGFGTGTLDSILPSGPSGFITLNLSSDKEFIENDGVETAVVTATLLNVQGDPSMALTSIQLGLLPGSPGSLYSMGLNYGSGEVQADLTSPLAGDNVVRSDFTLLNANIISQQITVSAVDLVTDTDGDGFADGEEQMGWDIVLDTTGYGTAGEGRLLITVHVTSDPSMKDTDADGLDDYLEFLIRTDPRSSDTDGDGLTDTEEWYRWMSSPTSVDTDGDARGPSHNLAPKPELFDGNELFLLSTSPTLDDTDGDSWTDYEEFDHPSRSPRIADLPRLGMTIEDDIDVRLDVQFAEETGQTRQYGTKLTKSQTQKTSNYSSRTIGHSLSIGASYSWGILGGATVSTNYTFSTKKTVAVTSESSQTAQESYSRYNTEARTRTETAATGSMTMGVRLTNTGNITYTITQLGITVRQWHPGAGDPANSGIPGSFTTIATLVPVLGGGITLAPGGTSPVLQIQAADLNPDRVKELLARPDSLHLEPAYYELENAEGLNFAYLEEITGPRTAMVFMDFGDGRTEEYRVAASVERNSDGSYAGVTLGEIMNQLLSIPYETRPRQFLDTAALTNERILYSVRDLATDETDLDNGFWTVSIPGSTSQQSGRDFEDLRVHGGEQVLFVYVKDQDGDGLYAAEEQHFRTDDEVSGDTDGDGLTDAEEVRGGWPVVLPSGTYFVSSDPTEADQDGDGLNDLAEMLAGTDPSLPDTDHDGLADNYDPHPLYPARVLHVKEGGTAINDGASWLTAMGSLVDALLEARNGNATALTADDDVAEIWVSSGRYIASTTGDRTASFQLSPGVSVFGGFAGNETKLAQRTNDPLGNPTTLTGDLNANDAESYANDPTTFIDNSLHVVYADSTVSSTTVLDGFFILGGNASGYSDTSHLNPDNQGGGLLSMGTPTLRNLFFRTNRATMGAGMMVDIPDATGKQMSISDCVFNRNIAYKYALAPYSPGRGGGAYISAPGIDFTVQNTIFSENESYGGGGLQIAGDGYRFFAENSVFDRNMAYFDYLWSEGGGGGLTLGGNGETARITNCRFSRNSGAWGSGFNIGDYTDVQLRQSVVWNNTVPNNGGGGAIYVRPNVTLWILNSDVISNTSLNPTGANGGVYNNGGNCRVENSILYGNTSSRSLIVADHQIWSGTNTMRTSLLQGLSASAFVGNGNIDGDPKFADEVNGNLRLSLGSAAIDKGSNYMDFDPTEPGFQLIPGTDLDGNPRFVDGNGNGEVFVDMGAYEFQGN